MRVYKKERNDSHRNNQTWLLPAHTMVIWKDSLSPQKRLFLLPLAMMWGGNRITSCSWPCPLLATTKINPVETGIRTLGKYNVSNRRYLSCCPGAVENNSSVFPVYSQTSLTVLTYQICILCKWYGKEYSKLWRTAQSVSLNQQAGCTNLSLCKKVILCKKMRHKDHFHALTSFKRTYTNLLPISNLK